MHWASDPRPEAEWDGITGVLEYEDASDQSWRTVFDLEVRGNVRYVTTRNVAPFA
jgi:hypothetical protein